MQIRNQIPNLHKNQLFKSGFASISSHPTASAKKVFSEIEPVIRQGNSIKPFITGLTKGGFLEIRARVKQQANNVRMTIAGRTRPF